MKQKLEQIIDDLEKLKNDPNGCVGDHFDYGFDCGISAAQERLREAMKSNAAEA